MADIDNYQDIIDSRDVEKRINELESEIDDLLAEENGPEVTEDVTELREELAILEEMRNNFGFSEWEWGLTLIRDSYFEDYAEQLAEDIGAIDRNASWPLNHIDWEAAARELQHDYSYIDYDGVTYLYRA